MASSSGEFGKKVEGPLAAILGILLFVFIVSLGFARVESVNRGALFNQFGFPPGVYSVVNAKTTDKGTCILEFQGGEKTFIRNFEFRALSIFKKSGVSPTLDVDENYANITLTVPPGFVDLES